MTNIIHFPKPKLTKPQKSAFNAYEKGREVAQLDFDLQSWPGIEDHFICYHIKELDQPSFHKGYLDRCVEIRSALEKRQ